MSPIAFQVPELRGFEKWRRPPGEELPAYTHICGV
jgi:hypothetical protein